MNNEQLYALGKGIDTIRKGCAIFMLLTFGPIIAYHPLKTFFNYIERKQRQPTITRITPTRTWYGLQHKPFTMIKASPRLSGYFPLRGFDYDNDGLLDKVEKLYHGGPRIPYGKWEEVEKQDRLFKKVQKEYDTRKKE
ncbi:hypothetical protein KY330_00110 [Candidatus Woesearchaeota archaeon]|nr:hypothetical protein [Candidatus Woesearchaeota archaeon]